MLYILKLAKSMSALLCCRPTLADLPNEKIDNSECTPIILDDMQKWYSKHILDHSIALPSNLYNEYEKGICIVRPLAGYAVDYRLH